MSRRRSRPARPAGLGDYDPVPDDVVEQARAAYQTRSTGPVAAIVSDAADEHGERHVRFEHGGVRVDLHVAAAGTRWDLRGHLDPPQLRVELELEGSAVSVAEDAASGRFSFVGVPGGIMRLRLIAHEATDALTTDWFRA